MWKLSFMITRHVNTRPILFLDVLIVSLKKHKILLLHFLLHGFLLLFHTNSDLFKLQTELSTEIQSGLQNPDRVYSPTIRAGGHPMVVSVNQQWVAVPDGRKLPLTQDWKTNTSYEVVYTRNFCYWVRHLHITCGSPQLENLSLKG